MQILFPCVNHIQHAYVERMVILLHSQTGHMAVHYSKCFDNPNFFFFLVLRYNERNCICNLLNTSRNKQFTLFGTCSFEELIIHGARPSQEVPVGTAGPIGGGRRVRVLPWRFGVFLI